MTYCNWCIIKVVSVVELSGSNVTPVTTCHVSSFEKCCLPCITHKPIYINI